ncbi:5'-nucleotidase [Pelolinea submarina]|nr:5'-nucleotidase [Pelolinea submarina]
MIMNSQIKQILLSNDDGVDSPGLWAAARALSELGYVTVSAPRDHMSATGRGYQKNSDGRITAKKLNVKDQDWDIYAVGGSPSQSVTHGVMELAPRKPDLVVTGINYGENFGTDVTYSGTVGAALEAAAMGIPALAVSQRLTSEEWDGFPDNVDFSISAYFTKFFAEILLKNSLPEDVDVLNVVVPEGATKDTPWKVTKLARKRYYKPYVIREGKLDEEAKIHSHALELDEIPPDSDMYTVRVERMVAVVPLSLDLTSRVAPDSLEKMLRK